jgi:hypothetical protein
MLYKSNAFNSSEGKNALNLFTLIILIRIIWTMTLNREATKYLESNKMEMSDNAVERALE